MSVESVALSQEELLTASLHIGEKNFPGLDMEPFENLSREQVNMIISVAERALIARNFLKPDGAGNWHITEPLGRILKACLNPEYTLLIQQTRPEQPAEHYFFHVRHKRFFLHTIPLRGIHQFIATTEADAIARATLSILDLPKEILVGDWPPSQIPWSAFEQARDLTAEKQTKEALATLIDNGMSESAARELVQALAQPRANATMARFHGKNHVNGLSLLQGQKTIWKLAPDVSNEDILHVTALDEKETLRLIREWTTFA